MANKRPKPEEIVSKLRQVEVLMGQGMSRLDAIRQIGVVEQTYYRWRKKYGGMGILPLRSPSATFSPVQFAAAITSLQIGVFSAFLD
ncbi:transposase [Ruegeria sp. HKCCD8929]|uniref:transposase n=1 Tax=Ruegeria sp. HKCCD8929 TaxID=2683006 RepID=UPI0014889DD7|nr:transposase [Ruegeria sp. HKCCD8929]